jgi:GNAT superfamily N-acetyltransferase
MKLQIKQITAIETYPIRHPLLRKGQALAACKLENDDHPASIHLGAFSGDQMVGVLSALPNPCPDHKTLTAYQLRAMAVEPAFQRKKIATYLIQHLLEKINRIDSIKLIWLNARVAANILYIKNGFQPIGDPFMIEPIGLHQRFIKFLNYES